MPMPKEQSVSDQMSIEPSFKEPSKEEPNIFNSDIDILPLNSFDNISNLDKLDEFENEFGLASFFKDGWLSNKNNPFKGIELFICIIDFIFGKGIMDKHTNNINFIRIQLVKRILYFNIKFDFKCDLFSFNILYLYSNETLPK